MVFNNSDKTLWVEDFKKIFLQQNFNEINKIFDVENFGLHNGMSLQEYCEYEFKEFKDKGDNFGLTLNAEIACYDLNYNFFYFSLGKKEDKALFEAIFGWNGKTKKAVGNSYFGKIEPKMQFIKKKNNQIVKLRKINFKPNENINIKKVILSIIPEEDYLQEISLEEIMGGKFYSYSYNLFMDNSKTYWETVKLYLDKKIVKYNVLMRGEDHPLFINDLYPIIVNEKEFKIKDDVYPVIIYVLKENGEEQYFKYPKNKHFLIDNKIKKICLTDNLSFDWIVEA